MSTPSSSSTKDSPPVLEAEHLLLEEPVSHSSEPTDLLIEGHSDLPELMLSSPDVSEVSACSLEAEERFLKSGKRYAACLPSEMRESALRLAAGILTQIGAGKLKNCSLVSVLLNSVTWL